MLMLPNIIFVQRVETGLHGQTSYDDGWLVWLGLIVFGRYTETPEGSGFYFVPAN
jgi:hypothetical protein